MHKSIYYNIRDSLTGEKLSGGSFSGELNQDTVDRLVAGRLSVVVSQSGDPFFINNKGRRVSLYIGISPAETTAGRLALADYRDKEEARVKAERQRERDLQALLDGMSTDEAIALLSRK